MSEQALRQRRVHAGHRLVEHDDLGVAHQCAGHLEELALSAGERAGEVVLLGVELEPGEQVDGLLGVRLLLRPPRPGMSARRKLSPRWPWAPSSMFSQHGQPGQRLGELERADDAHTGDLVRGGLAQSRPSKVQLPVLGWSNPVSRLNSVVLPAPFGPIRPVMPPRWISRWSTETAVRPPKRARDAVDDDHRVRLGHPDLPGEVAQRRLGEPAGRVPALEGARFPRVVAVPVGRHRSRRGGTGRRVSGHRASPLVGRRISPAAGRSTTA